MLKNDYFETVNSFFKGHELETLENCYLCGEKADIPLGKITRCSNCGLFYNIKQPTQETLDKFYQSLALDKWAIIKETNSERIKQDEKFSTIWSWLRESKPDKVLDVGCGNGYFLNNVDSAVVKVGIEPSAPAREHCNFAVYGNYDSFKESLHGQTKYDVITMFGLLEHLKDPIAEIKKYAEHLTNEGTIIAIVPNEQSLVVKTLGLECSTFCPQHLWHFSIDTLCMMFGQAGFAFQRWRTIEPELQPILKKLKGFRPYTDLKITLTDRDITEKAILDTNQGYKIIAMFGREK